MFRFLIFFLVFYSIRANAYLYGRAGCGLGSVIFGPEGNVPATVLSNSTSMKSFSISSGTSNCVPEGGEYDMMHVASKYIEANEPWVVEDLSKGEGKTLVDIADIYRCNLSFKLGPFLKRNQILRSQNNNFPSAKDISNRIDSLLRSSPEGQKNCLIKV